MPGWTSSLQSNSNIINYNSYLDSNDPVKNTNLAFDLSSLDYNAAGAEGWGNRILGLTSIVNPLSWVSTWIGVNEANTKKRAAEGREGDFFSNAWDNIIGVGGEALEGIFSGTQIVEKGATGLLLSVGSGLEELNDLISGKNDKDTWLDKVGKSWDLSNTGEIGAGKSLLYGLGQIGKLVTGNGWDKKGLVEAGNGWLDHDFDIFNKDDRELLNQGFVMGNVGAVVNFVGEIFLDVTSLIPGGTFARIGHKLVGGAKAGSKMELELLDAARTAKSTTPSMLTDTLDWLATNKNIEEIDNYLVAKGVAADRRAQFATLVQKADTRDEVIDVVIAMDHGGEDALAAKARLIEKVLSKSDSHYTLFAIDSIDDSGRLANLTRDPKFAGQSEILTREIGEDFDTAVKKLLDDATVDAPIKEAVEEISNVGKFTTRLETGELTDIAVQASSREFGLVSTDIGRKYIGWKSKVTSDDGIFKFIEYTNNLPFIPNIVRVIRRAGRTSSKQVNWNNPAVVIDQFKSRLADIDSITKGQFAKSGSSAEYLERFLAARTDTAMRTVWKELDDFAEEAIIRKHKLIDVTELDAARGKLITAFREEFIKQADEFSAGATKFDPRTNTIIKKENSGEIITEGQLANEEAIVDWNALDNYLRKEGKITGRVDDVTRAFEPAARTFNSLWSQIILIRPARLGRERIYGAAGILLSGNFYDVFLSSNARDAYKNWFYNLPDRADRLIDRYNVKQSITGSYVGDINKAIVDRKKAAARIDRTRNEIIEIKERLAKKQKARIYSQARVKSAEERLALAEAELKESLNTYYHATNATTGAPIPNDAEFIALSDSADTAKGYVNPGLKPVENKRAEARSNAEEIDSTPTKLTEASTARETLVKQRDELKANNIVNDVDPADPRVIQTVNSYNLVKKISVKLNAINSGFLPTSKLQEIVSPAAVAEAAKDYTLIGAKQLQEAAQVKLAERAGSKSKEIAKLDAKIAKLDSQINDLNNTTTKINSDIDADLNHPQRTAVLESLAEGEVIYSRTNRKDSIWKPITTDEFNRLTPKQLNDREFATGQPNATTLEVGSYQVAGKKIDIDNAADELPDELWQQGSFRSKEEFLDWIRKGKENGALANNCSRAPGVIQAMTVAGIGAFHFIDNFGNKVSFANPDLVVSAEKNPLKKVAQDSVENNRDGLADAIANPEKYDFDLKTKEQIDYQTIKAKEMLDKINADSTDPEQLSQFFDNVNEEIDRLTVIKQKLDRDIIDLEAAATPTTAGIQKRSTGKVAYAGQVFDNFAEGRNGEYAAAIASPGDTWNKLHNSDRMSNAVYGSRGRASNNGMNPDHPLYFDGLASWLQVYGRGDAVVTMLASGKSVDEIVDWLKSSKAGKEYADRMKIGSKHTKADAIAKLDDEVEVGYHEPFESFVADRATIVNEQMFTAELKELFNSGEEITSAKLREMFSGKENILLPIAGRLLNPASGRRVLTHVGDFFRKVNRLLVEKPQEVLENFPLATELYQKNMKQLIDDNIASTGRKLNIKEINALQDIARRRAITEMQKWMYNVQKRTNFEDAVSLLVPFVTAYTFTVKMFMRAVREQPEKALWTMAGINNTLGQLNWVDENGEPTNMLQASALVIPISEDIRKVLKDTPFGLGAWLADAEEFTLSAKSLNVFFGGEIIPAPGPFISVPVSEWVKANPVLAARVNNLSKDLLPFIPGGEGLVDYLLPMGPSEKPLSYNQLLPGWINQGLDANAIGRWFGSDYRGQQYLDAMGKVAAYESAKARMLGPDEPLPTESEIMEKVDSLYALKFTSAFFSPVAFQVKTEADLAKREYLKYKKIYGDSAEWMFLTQRPELLGAVASTIKNPYNLDSNLETASNLENNKDVVEIFMNAGEGGKDMLGFFMNSTNNPAFDDYAYTYLTQKGAGVSEDAYYTKMSTSERVRRAAASAGWIKFNRLMSVLDAEAIETNTSIEASTKLRTIKSTAIAELRTLYPEWAAEYSKQDAYKFAERANTLEELFTSKSFLSKFGNKPEVNAIAIFLTQRAKIQDTLRQRKALGYSGSIESQSNQDIAMTYNQIIYQLKTESLRFADFYNRFFDGDSLVF